MRHPWQYWATFFLGLAIVLPAMSWLTIKAMELDQANAVARRQAELEQQIGRALWRMDAVLTPLLASEAARPNFVYRTSYATICEDEPAGKQPSKPQVVQTLSPLVAEPPEFVLLHFEVLPDGQVVSPQSPSAKEAAWARDNGAAQQTLDIAAIRLVELKHLLANLPLADKLPTETLPPAGYALANSGNTLATQNNPAIVNRVTQSRGAGGGNFNYNGSYGQSFYPQEGVQPNAPPQQSLSNNTQPQQQAANPGRQPAPQQQTYQQPVQQAVAANPQVGLQPGNSARQQTDFPPEPLILNQQEDGQQLALAPNAFEPQGRNIRSKGAANDLENRDAALQAYAQKAVSEQRLNNKMAIETTPAVVGVSQPMWLDGRLLLARRVQVGNQVRVQGCWLDWDRLQQRLKAEVADLLPLVEFTPVASDDESVQYGRLLASLPVQITVPMPPVQPATYSPIRVSLMAAWGCLLLVAIAAAITLQSVVTLSERRASFVSAVTHELRTPLTTFRMYAEMLAGGMVPEGEQRQHYLETLRVEADRLAHLVDNVLQYARLERTNPNRARREVAVQDLFDRQHDRLRDRALQAEMELSIDTKSCPDQLLVTDPQAVEQILFNLVDNACKYAAHVAKKRIEIDVTCEGRKLLVNVRDYGPGISATGRKTLFRPFSKSVHEAALSAPGVGLGLALCERLARDLGGRLQFQPAEPGCSFCLQLPLA